MQNQLIEILRTISFLKLNDTPEDYLGAINYLLRVNSAGDGIEYVDPSSLSIGLPDYLADDTDYACDSGVAVGDCVYFDGTTTLQKSSNNDVNTLPVIGIVREKQSSTTARLQFFGDRASYSGLTPNTRYYLGLNGAITATVPTASGAYIVPIGIGKNSSTIEIRLTPYQIGVD